MRYTFGQSLTDWTMRLGAASTDGEGITTAPALAAGPYPVTFWSEAVGGVQYTDLLTSAGTPVTAIVSAGGSDALPVGTTPEFFGPDEVTEMWADAGGGARFKMVATNLGGVLADLRTRVSVLEGVVELLQQSLGVIVYDGGWPERPADDRPYAWIGPSAPTGGAGDVWFDTTP